MSLKGRMKRRRQLLLGGGKQKKRDNEKNDYLQLLKKSKTEREKEQEVDTAPDIHDLLSLCGPQATSTEEKQTRPSVKRKALDPHQTPRYRKKKYKPTITDSTISITPTGLRITRKTWVVPLPESFQILLKKFIGLENAICTYIGRGKMKVEFSILSNSVSRVCKKDFTNIDMLRIENLMDKYYRVGWIEVKEKYSGLLRTALGVTILKKHSSQRVLTHEILEKRKCIFRTRLEEEVIKQHAEFVKKSALGDKFLDVRKSKCFHPKFDLNDDCLITKITYKRLEKQIKKNSAIKQVRDILDRGKGTRFDSKKIQDELKKNISSMELAGLSTPMKNAVGLKAKKLTPNTRKRIIAEAHPKLRHLSPTLILKATAKKKANAIVAGDPLLVKQKKRMEDLLYMMNLIRSICTSGRKRISLPYEDIITKITQSHKRRLTKEEVLVRMTLLFHFCPGFATLRKTISMRIFILNRKCNVGILRTNLNKEIKKVERKCHEQGLKL